VNHGRGQLARDLVHVRDHKEQALGRCKGGGEGPGLQGAVQRAGSSAFALHLDDGAGGCDLNA